MERHCLWTSLAAHKDCNKFFFQTNARSRGKNSKARMYRFWRESFKRACNRGENRQTGGDV